MTRNQISYWDLKERERSNKANEKETHRSNKAREQETNRHNVVTEQETERHNRAMEGLTLAQVTEQQRHNMQTELQASNELAERQRSNLANEEIGRLNVAVGFANVALGYSRLAEETRHNQANESLTLGNLQETVKRDNDQYEYNQSMLNETIRSHQANEQQNFLNWANSKTSVTETSRHNTISENLEEFSRRNKAFADYLNVVVSGAGVATKAYGLK